MSFDFVSEILDFGICVLDFKFWFLQLLTWIKPYTSICMEKHSVFPNTLYIYIVTAGYLEYGIGNLTILRAFKN